MTVSRVGSGGTRTGLALALAAAIAAALGAPPAAAERADREQPTRIESDRMLYDDAKQTNVFTGNVVLTKGTIRIRGDRLVLRQDPEGFQYGTATGRPASFRQRRDGTADEYIEGYGNQIEYDGRNETVRLTGNARMLRLPGAAPADEIHGGVIFYDARTEQVSVDGAPPGQDRGRVRVVIQPRSGGPREAPAAAAPAPALKPAPRLAQPPEAPRR